MSVEEESSGEALEQILPRKQSEHLQFFPCLEHKWRTDKPLWFMVVLLFLPMMLWMLGCWDVMQVSVPLHLLGIWRSPGSPMSDLSASVLRSLS